MTDVGSLVLLNVIFWMYASLTQELFMHPLLVLLILEKKQTKKLVAIFMNRAYRSIYYPGEVTKSQSQILQ